MINGVAAMVASALTAALLTAAVLTGCSSTSGDCSSVCVKTAACSKGAHVPPGEVEMDCDAFCQHEQKLADDSNCDSEYSAFVACTEDLANVCTAKQTCTVTSEQPEVVCTGQCGKEDTALARCTAKFCSDPKNKSLCSL